jgi:hypothetical protein
MSSDMASVDVVVNGCPIVLTLKVGSTMRLLVELAIEKAGQIGRSVDDWIVRDDDGHELSPLDDWLVGRVNPSRLWLSLGVGKCEASAS